MIKNYLLIALRNLSKNKSYVIINTFGLGISLACCITAYLLLAYNIEFDNFHRPEKVANIFKIHTHKKEKSGKINQTVTAPMVLASMASQDIVGINRYARYIQGGGYIRYGENAFAEGIAFADSTFFDMFDFPMVQGNQKSFKDKRTIILSQKLATKYFSKEDPIGKLLVVSFPNNIEIEVMVGGVIDKVPLNSTFIFDAIMRIENYLDINALAVDNWKDWRDPSTFMELSSPEIASRIGKQFSKYVPIRNEAKKDDVVDSYHLEPFLSNFNSDDIRDRYINLRISKVPLMVFTLMALMILLIACFNLTNTSIAMTAKRLKEVGVRKAVGAARWQIVAQFLLETVVTILMALIVGIILAEFIVPAFARMWKLPYGLADLSGVNLFITIVVLVFLASLLAGIYPALFNSKFKPVVLLKGNVKVKGTNIFTRVLVTLQFALSVIVLIAGVIFIQNTKFQEKIKFGYDKEMIVTVNIQSEKEFEAMENRVSENPKILSVAVSDHHIGYNNYQNPVQVDTGSYDVRVLGIGKNYAKTIGFIFSEGRDFDVNNATDTIEGIIVNKAFLEKTKLKDPLDKIIILHETRRRIVGVIENHVDNLYRSRDPEAFVFYPAEPKNYKIMLVRANASDLGETQKYLQKTWKELFPGKSFESKFQEDIVLGNVKDTNSNLQTIFLFLTALGGLLSAAGIFALASLNITKRTKEIGIRKALGATIGGVVTLLNKEFIIVLLIAGILGSVGGYYLTDALLGQIYAYHISVSLIPVILSAVLIFGIGIFTTSLTILKAAKADPVKTLRSE